MRIVKTLAYLSFFGALTLLFHDQIHASEAAVAVTTGAQESLIQTKSKQPTFQSARGKQITTSETGSKYEQAIMKLLHLPMKDHQGSCLRSVIDQHFSGKEMFAVEKCPFIQSATLKLLPDLEHSDSSKGKLEINISCSIQNNDYYVGKLKKSFKQDAVATIEAEYIYALGDLSLKNLSVKGDQFCANPIKVQIKKYQ